LYYGIVVALCLYFNTTFQVYSQRLWDIVANYVGHNDFTLSVVIPIIAMNAVQYSLGAFYLLIDVLKLECLAKYKHQPRPKKHDKKFHGWNVVKCMLTVVFNTTVLDFAIYYFILFPIQQRLGISGNNAVPNLITLVVQYQLYLWASDIINYGLHRAMHTKPLYWIHKMHHEWTAPISFTTFYGNPLEHFIFKVFMRYLIIFSLGMHPFVAIVILILSTASTMHDHSGYSLPYISPSGRFHDVHHEKSTVNFGDIGGLSLDKRFGTEDTSYLTKTAQI
jgi:methylsterol monooxygenase